MKMIAIAAAAALEPAPFETTPHLAITLQTDLGTQRRYVQARPDDADMEMLDAEARAIEATGQISETDLAADWRLDTALLAAEDAQVAGDLEHAADHESGWSAPAVESEQGIEPLA